MRQKPPSEDTIGNYVFFLSALKGKCSNGEPFKIGTVIKAAGVSSQASSSAQSLGIITKGKERWLWNVGQADRVLALKLLDHMLHKNKKQIHVPLMPELATAITLLSTVSEKMNNVLVQQEFLLKRIKQANNEPAILSETLFSEDQEEKESFQLLLAVTTGHYGNYDYLTPFDQINDRIINAHQDLFTKYINLKKSKNGQQ